jgi:hypothetical protein
MKAINELGPWCGDQQVRRKTSMRFFLFVTLLMAISISSIVSSGIGIVTTVSTTAVQPTATWCHSLVHN